ncbi:hypothetical protein D3C87_2208060 [compost metagenome]
MRLQQQASLERRRRGRPEPDGDVNALGDKIAHGIPDADLDGELGIVIQKLP